MYIPIHKNKRKTKVEKKTKKNIQFIVKWCLVTKMFTVLCGPTFINTQGCQNKVNILKSQKGGGMLSS